MDVPWEAAREIQTPLINYSSAEWVYMYIGVRCLAALIRNCSEKYRMHELYGRAMVAVWCDIQAFFSAVRLRGCGGKRGLTDHSCVLLDV